MRYLPNVIDEILREIPESEEGLRETLQALKSSAEHSAPEVIGAYWQRGDEVVNDRLPEDEAELSEWQRRVVNIWTGREREEV